MESEKVKEIKKALNCCISGNDCTENCCTYYKNKKSFKCMDDLLKDILTLINELESENERLRSAKVVYETVDYCAEDLRKAQERIAELEKELEKEQINNINCDTELQYKEKRIAELEKEKTEQLREFAERLKEKAIVFFDETLIETTEGV